MAEQIFREKSLKRISSPEELQDYIKVANPGIWLLLIGVIVLFIGIFVWSEIGTIDSKVTSLGIVKNNNIDVYISENNISKVDVGTIIIIDDKEYTLSSISKEPIKISKDEIDEYKLHLGNLNDGDWVYIGETNIEFKNGVYPVEVVLERINPFSLLFSE